LGLARRVVVVEPRLVLLVVRLLLLVSEEAAALPRPRVGAASALGAAVAAAALSACARDIKRDLCLAAALGWMMPRLAALSRALTAWRTVSAALAPSLGEVTASEAFLTNVRTAERAARLLAVRRSVCRIAFWADLVLAKTLLPVFSA
jgi:hypothetical protein